MAGGRPKVFVERLLADYPPPTPQPTPCRIWQGSQHSSGYGMLAGRRHQPDEPSPLRGVRGGGRWNPDSGFRRGSTSTRLYAHRWVWEAVNGPIPTGMVVRHKCDNRLCYRLSHLELGTVADNNDDARKRGHLGTVLILAPSQVELIFDLHDAGWSDMRIHREHFDGIVSRHTINRIRGLGRQAFDDLWDPTKTGYSHKPDPLDRYGNWRNDERRTPVRPDAVHGRETEDATAANGAPGGADRAAPAGLDDDA